MFRHIKVSLLALTIATAGAAAHAANSDRQNDAMSINKAQIGLTQAIAAAEQRHPGSKASRAEFEQSKKSGWVYDVEVVSGSKVFDVKVDPQKGTVISSVEDRGDHGDDHDSRD
ncbi:MAG: peptidase M4 [Gallionellaceae bacterium]|nr:MAG: peptidase M4 [Gallionellaceae bacterium]